MKLLKLPYIPLIEVLKQIEISELFLLSFVSKKTKRLVQNVRSSTVETLMVCKSRYGDISFVLEGYKTDRGVVSCNFESREEDVEMKETSLNIGGNLVNCGISFDDGLASLCINENLRDSILMPLHNYICELFKTRTDLQLVINLNRQSDIPITTTIEDLLVVGRPVDARVLDSFLDRHTVSKRAQIAPEIEEKLRYDSKIWRVENLFLSQYNLITRKHLINFQGINACFAASDIREPGLVGFIKNWRKGNNTTLRTMIIIPRNEYSTERVLSRLRTIPWNPQKRPEKYPYSQEMKEFIGAYQQPEFVTPGVDIMRKSDGTRATIIVEHGNFAFFVWKEPYPVVEEEGRMKLYYNGTQLFQVF